MREWRIEKDSLCGRETEEIMEERERWSLMDGGGATLLVFVTGLPCGVC